MNPRHVCDAIVIGGGVSGLTAAAYLATAGKKTVLFEASNKFGGTGAQPLYALDPRVVKDFKLSRRGLQYAVRDMALTGLRADGKHIVISRDAHRTAASIAIHSKRDSEIWPRFRRELFDLARAMRPSWWERGDPPSKEEYGRELGRLSQMGASAWLDSWFESDALKATLCFDACASGLSILEPGSALTLVWRAAQEISGHQGAVALPKGGSDALPEALVAAAQASGAELRTGTRISHLLMEGNSIVGVQLASQESCFAPIVLSTVSRRQTLFDLTEQPLAGIAEIAADARHDQPPTEARIVLTISDAPLFGGVAVPLNGRFVFAEKPESYVAAEMTARMGRVADELPLELTLPNIADPSLAPSGQHIVSVLVRSVPRWPATDWPELKAHLAACVVKSLGKILPAMTGSLSRVEVIVSNDPSLRAGHMLANAAKRVQTPIEGLFACGDDAEPVCAVSGRAARIAAAIAAGKP